MQLGLPPRGVTFLVQIEVPLRQVLVIKAYGALIYPVFASVHGHHTKLSEQARVCTFFLHKSSFFALLRGS